MHQLIGIKRQISSTSSSWTRTNASQGMVANACLGTISSVQNDFDNIYPWKDIISYNYDTSLDQITAYHGDINFRFDGSNGEVLTYIPKFYYKRYQEGGYEYIDICKYPKKGYVLSSEFSVGRYLTSEDGSGKLHSISRASVSTGKTIADYRNLTKNTLGTEFCLYDTRHFVLQLLYLVEYADYNCQAKLRKWKYNSCCKYRVFGCNRHEIRILWN